MESLRLKEAPKSPMPILNLKKAAKVENVNNSTEQVQSQNVMTNSTRKLRSSKHDEIADDKMVSPEDNSEAKQSARKRRATDLTPSQIL